ncbi:MAG: glycoside hydrolase [Chloroflexi bacterium]|nr:glycoside hydrolase [Chloroflexota bacterium]
METSFGTETKTTARARCAGFGGKLFLGWTVLLATFPAATAQPASLLWQIGQPDNSNREFALAPNHFAEFREDGFFVVGRSDPKRDWPYVQPGPGDGWAGSREHAFSIVFGVKNPPATGACKLRVDLIDTHGSSPPRLRIRINGRAFEHSTPRGAGDDSVNGQPAKGKEHKFDVSFPAELLKAGANEVGITTVSGSWMLYDWIALESPPGVETAEVTGTVVSSMRSPPVLIEKEGRLAQIVQLSIRHFGEETKALVRVDGTEATNLTLRAAAQNLEVPVASVEKETPVKISVEVAGQTLAAQTLPLKPVRKWVVYLLPHSHVDIGYTHVQTEVERAQWRYLETAIDTARKTAGHPPGARFKWNVEVLWAVDGYLKQATPEKQREFMDAVKAGQIGLDALYGNELTGLCRPEELLRLTSYAMKLSQRTGVPIESAMITDVPGYTWGIVPAFAHSGVKYWSIGPNGGDRIGHTIAAWGDKPFWWIGPNGRDKVLVWMTGTGYYQVFQSAGKLQEYLTQLEQKGYPYDMVHVRHCLGDNGAPDVNFADTVKKWNESHAYPKLVIATTAEMFRDFENRYGDTLPTAKGDFTPYWEDGAASSARETALNRAAADRLTQAETLFAMLNPTKYPVEEFYQAWRNAVLYDEHTWGAHNSISQPDHPFVKSQWAIKQAFALEADRQSRALLEKSLAGRGPSGARIEAVDVFNTTSWTRADELVVAPKDLALAGDAVKDADGKPVLSQRLSTGELAFLAGDIPPFASRRYTISAGRPLVSGKARVDGATLVSSRVALRVDDQTGAIVSLLCKAVDAELADAKAPAALNDYLYLPGSDLKGLKRNGPVKISARETGPLVASLVIESDAPGCHKLTRELRVVEGLDRVDILNVVDKQPVREKEGVHFGFAFNVPGGEVRLDVPWAVVRPEADQIAGACKNWFTVQRWVDISNQDYGVTWATLDAPLVEVGDVTANLIGSLSNPKAWLEHLEPSQTIYSWAMNNHWHTNYRAEQEGPTVFRYALWPHGPFSAEAAAKFGVAVSQPLIVVPASDQAMSEPRLRVEPSSVLVTAFKPSEDGKAWIVRLFGASGKTERAKVAFADPAPKTIWLSDNSERPSAPVSGSIEVSAFSIVTLRADIR